jgi:hypothetical protein
MQPSRYPSSVPFLAELGPADWLVGVAPPPAAADSELDAEARRVAGSNAPALLATPEKAEFVVYLLDLEDGVHLAIFVDHVGLLLRHRHWPRDPLALPMDPERADGGIAQLHPGYLALAPGGIFSLEDRLLDVEEVEQDQHVT